MPIREITVDELAARLEDGAALVDVRQPDEYALGHVASAVLIPLASLGTLGLGVVVAVHEGAEVLVIANGLRARRARSLTVAAPATSVATPELSVVH